VDPVNGFACEFGVTEPPTGKVVALTEKLTIANATAKAAAILPLHP
jgi:hypothetical protein